MDISVPSPRVGIKTENLKKTNKNRFLKKNRFLSGFFQISFFFKIYKPAMKKNTYSLKYSNIEL